MSLNLNDEELKEAIQKDQNEVHAPSELIAVTKKKIAEAEKYDKVNHERKSLIHKITYIVSACAAILILFVLSTGLSNLEFFAHQQNGTELRLGNHNDENVFLDDEIEIEKTKVLPIEFQNTVTETLQINHFEVKITCDDNGYYMAVYEEEMNYIVLRSKEDEKEKFILIITKILNK